MCHTGRHVTVLASNTLSFWNARTLSLETFQRDTAVHSGQTRLKFIRKVYVSVRAVRLCCSVREVDGSFLPPQSGILDFAKLNLLDGTILLLLTIRQVLATFRVMGKRADRSTSTTLWATENEGTIFGGRDDRWPRLRNSEVSVYELQSKS